MKFIRGAQGEWLNRRFIRRIYSMRDQATAKKRYLWFALTDTPTEDGTPHELHRNAAISGAEDESLRIIPATVPMNMLVIWWDQDTDDFEIRSYPIIAWRLYGFDQPMIQGYAFPIVRASPWLTETKTTATIGRLSSCPRAGSSKCASGKFPQTLDECKAVAKAARQQYGSRGSAGRLEEEESRG